MGSFFRFDHKKLLQTGETTAANGSTSTRKDLGELTVDARACSIPFTGVLSRTGLKEGGGKAERERKQEGRIGSRLKSLTRAK